MSETHLNTETTKKDSGKVIANHVNLVERSISLVELTYENGVIRHINALNKEDNTHPYLIPGFVDAHVHIESSMLTPDEFAHIAMSHGTLASISDPHEIANVLGEAGINYMIERASLTPFIILFGAPSCVPATPFETTGAELTASRIEHLFRTRKAGYLSEVMNYPGVLQRAPFVMEKIEVAKKFGVPIDGHAPGIMGEDSKTYAEVGITTDHECMTLDEAIEKIDAGMHILLREGSAARNFEALHPLLKSHPDRVMLCSDDKHPDDLLEGHIDKLAARAISLGYNLFDVLCATSLNPIKHYGLDLGLLQKGDSMDGLLVKDLKNFDMISAYIHGQKVADHSGCLLNHIPITPINHFNAEPVNIEQLKIPYEDKAYRVIEVQDGQLLTHEKVCRVNQKNGFIEANTEEDILFIVVYNRYTQALPSVALIHGFGLTSGAIASTVAHDSHNIIAVGTSAKALETTINGLVTSKGGLAILEDELHILPLPVAGLMSDQPATTVGPAYKALTKKANKLGSQLRAPFMTLSFMALLVIPELKLSDKGLFNGNTFEFCTLAVD